jgi:magnesium chelatase family protein
LRGPLEGGTVRLPVPGRSRSLRARFQLIGAMNPCPCGFRGDEREPCRCSPKAVDRYLRPLSAAVLDRIDLMVTVPRVSLQELRSGAGEGSEMVARRVAAAREVQRERCGRLNAALDTAGVRVHCGLDANGRRLFELAVEKLGFTARSLNGLLKLARTIADLQGSDSVRAWHLAEAIQYRARVSDPEGGAR